MKAQAGARKNIREKNAEALADVSCPAPRQILVYEPCLCMAAQGAKLVTLAGESYVYDENRYLIASVNLPTMAQVIHASEKSPYYGFKLKLDPGEIAQVMLEGDGDVGKRGQPERGIALADVDARFLMRYAGWRSFSTAPKTLRCFLR